jgi:hypothetical protein
MKLRPLFNVTAIVFLITLLLGCLYFTTMWVVPHPMGYVVVASFRELPKAKKKPPIASDQRFRAGI